MVESLLKTACLFAFLFSSLGSQSQAIKTQAVQKGDKWILEVGGAPFYIKGAGGIKHQKLLIEAGGNTIRTWGTENGQEILDEAQNATHSQMKMFLTRMGPEAKFIITGDPGQVDLPKKIKSGLNEALNILKKTSGIKILNLDEKDVIRHKLVKKIITAYN